MKTPKIKTFIVTTLLMLTFLGHLMAQDKYEFATITYGSYGYDLIVSVSLNGKEFSKSKVTLSKEENSYLNTNPLLIKINEFQDKGWEVVNITFTPLQSSAFVYFSYLRKKEKLENRMR